MPQLKAPILFLKKRNIFAQLKATVYILSLVMAFLMVQPLIPVNNKKECCSEKCCKKEENKRNNKTNKDCNPLLNCPFCTLFIVNKSHQGEINPLNTRDKILIRNDNRVIKNLSECWHPPNFTA